MAKNFESDGSVIQWTNGTGSAVASGQVDADPAAVAYAESLQ